MRILLAFLISIFIMGPVFSKSIDLAVTSRDINGFEGGELWFGSDVLVRFFSAKPGQAVERANQLKTDLLRMLAMGLTDADIQTGFFNGQMQARVRNQPIFVVTQQEVDVNKTPPEVLAKEWVLRLRPVFADSAGRVSGASSARITPFTAMAALTVSPELAPFTAMCSKLPVGAMIRLINPKSTWSVVVTAVTPRGLPRDLDMAIDSRSAELIGIGIVPTTVRVEPN